MDTVHDCECGKKQYGYTDGVHNVYICYNCGRFDGVAHGDASFIAMISEDPLVLLGMIKEEYLIPMK